MSKYYLYFAYLIRGKKVAAGARPLGGTAGRPQDAHDVAEITVRQVTDFAGTAGGKALQLQQRGTFHPLLPFRRVDVLRTASAVRV
jgi:hypothetical protein